VFFHIDSNNDGSICKSEIRAALKDQGLNVGDNEKADCKLNQALNFLDKDQDGFISFTEFLVAAASQETFNMAPILVSALG